MTRITFGSTGIVIEKNGFGGLPIQRISRQEAADLLHRAVDGGINFFDTARAYSDSEEKMGYAFRGMRDKVVIASKSGALTGEKLTRDLDTSLKELGTDYIDIYQFHNPPFCPKPGGEDGLYDAALEAKRQGKIRHIGISNHRLPVAHEAIDSGLYETLQFPYSYLSGEKDQELVDKCREKGMGFIAMKGMAGGLLRDGTVAAAWMARQEGVVPIWGVQHQWELDQFPGLREPDAGVDRGVSADGGPGPERTVRRLLPLLRLLHALPRGHPDQPVCPDGADAPAYAPGGLPDPVLAG